MATTKVDVKLIDASSIGDAKFLKGDGTWDTAGGGKVLQVVQPTAITGFATSTTSATFVDLTGITLDITPTLTTSKILVCWNLNIGVATGWHAQLRLVRDSTPIAIGDASGSRTQATADVGANVSILNPSSIMFLDEPNTTSATTYKAQWASESGGTIYLNRSHGNTDAVRFCIGASTITAWEIGA